MYSDKDIIDIVHKVLDTYDEWGRVIFTDFNVIDYIDRNDDEWSRVIFTDFNVIDYIDRNEIIEIVLSKKPYYESAKRLSRGFYPNYFVDYFTIFTKYQTIFTIKRETKRIVREFKINNLLNE